MKIGHNRRGGQRIGGARPVSMGLRMFGTTGFHLSRMRRAIWFLPALFSVGAILALLLAAQIGPYLPTEVTTRLDLSVADRILSILASSMLAVAIFSLTTMVTAIQAAAQSATPRVRSLLVQDRSAQSAISVFLGTFLYSLLGLIGLSLGIYDEAGRAVLFAVTLMVIGAVVVTLIRWIEQLSRIGGIAETIERAETAARSAFASLAANPLHGGWVRNDLPERSIAVLADRIGHVQYIDGARLGMLAETAEVDVHIAARPGAYVDRTRPLAFVFGEASAATVEAIRGGFVVGRERVFDSDPQFGLMVLSEIASRALSPAVNDPGTAIDVVATLTRVLDDCAEGLILAEPEVVYPRLSVGAIDVEALIRDAFAAIARDGAGIVEVQLRLQQSLAALAATNRGLFARPASRMSREALLRARAAMAFDGDIALVEDAATAVDGAAAGRLPR